MFNPITQPPQNNRKRLGPSSHEVAVTPSSLYAIGGRSALSEVPMWTGSRRICGVNDVSSALRLLRLSYEASKGWRVKRRSLSLLVVTALCKACYTSVFYGSWRIREKQWFGLVAFRICFKALISPSARIPNALPPRSWIPCGNPLEVGNF